MSDRIQQIRADVDAKGRDLCLDSMPDHRLLLNHFSRIAIQGRVGHVVIAKPECFMLPAPNSKQVAEQNAAECFPLIMEPQPAFYKGPLLVLDFRSLYPSVTIASSWPTSHTATPARRFLGACRVKIADSIVPSGRETLERAILSDGGVGCSSGVRRHGQSSDRSKDNVFRVGNEIADAVTEQNPKPSSTSLRRWIRNARQLSLKRVCLSDNA